MTTAGHLAWVAPVVVVAGAAPALAMSGAPNVAVGPVTGLLPGNSATRDMNVTVPLSNIGGEADSVTVVVTMTAAETGSSQRFNTNAVKNLVGGFNLVSAVLGGDDVANGKTVLTATFSSTATPALAADGGTSTLAFTVTLVSTLPQLFAGRIDALVTTVPTGSFTGTGGWADPPV